MTKRILKTSDIVAAEIAVPPGHRHLRCTLYLRSGEEFVLPEAALAALARAFVTVKTHPCRRSLRLVGRELAAGEGKMDFASWQLLEAE
jgi:hypothetical protein